MALDIQLLLELTGASTDCFSVFGPTISSIDDLKREDELSASADTQWCHSFEVYKMLISFWNRNYSEAEKVHFICSIYHESLCHLVY